MHEAGTHGIGFKIRKGEKVVIPSDWLKLSLNPLKSKGQLSRYGLQWFAEQIHLNDLPKKKGKMAQEIDMIEAQCDRILDASALLSGFNLEDPTQSEQIIEKLKANRDTAEWWAFLAGTFISVLREAITECDVEQAVWAMGCVERCRSMLLFKEHLEEVIWMGHSAKRLVDVLHTWENNKSNSDEGFWQITLRDNAYAISQVFAVPLVFIQESAYVGGMNVNRQDAKLVDYLFSQESSREAVLVEIKTPATRLLGRKYRGVYSPSPELSGGVMQALDYRRTLSENLISVIKGIEHKLTAFEPKCVLIIGNGELELDSDLKRNSFEIFRSNSKNVEVITYDELFRKLEVLASLFSLTRGD
ncbi:Shedu immune nuclease family protein [Thiohalomonas denitrificans]|uniref:Shedu immune nuclease family protein n=1 Tax=Thiohalomonas denitrificans TaxID=415747 RepID=UPI0026EBF577|nr:Shedu immune nuclease family protein [Thiohalomonas denitrificans]